jgi:hypothetical protein
MYASSLCSYTSEDTFPKKCNFSDDFHMAITGLCPSSRSPGSPATAEPWMQDLSTGFFNRRLSPWTPRGETHGRASSFMDRSIRIFEITFRIFTVAVRFHLPSNCFPSCKCRYTKWPLLPNFSGIYLATFCETLFGNHCSNAIQWFGSWHELFHFVVSYFATIS